MPTYTMYYPSGRLFKDGVEFAADDTNADYQDYVAWLSLGNGPDYVPDPVSPAPPTATIARIATAMERLGIVAPTADEMTGQIFPLAVTL